jgi:RNA 2',3'-cyclic 3'-phosphodiesterase
MENVKLAIAVDLNSVEKQALHCITYGLRTQCKVGLINPEEMYHVTLHFFEEVPLDRVKDIELAMSNAAKGQAPFTLVTGKPGQFGSEDSSVVWIGINSGVNELVNLHSILEKQLVKAGFLEDIRPYQPHITLGREIDTRAIQPKLSEFILSSVNLTARGLTLLQRKLVDGKPVYETLANIKFAEAQ